MSDTFPAYVMESWERALFEETDAPEVGQRLGIQYVRTLRPTIDVTIGNQLIQLHQESMGMMAISGVVWDAGLLVSDFIAQCADTTVPPDRVLDLGCGTGIAGICSLITGARDVVFSDIERLSCFDSNVEQLDMDLQRRTRFEVYKWNEDTLPASFQHTNADGEDSPRIWDTVLCSDLLYESKHHAALLSVLRRIKFKQIIFSYKKRHDEAEKAFFRALSEWCTVRVVDSACIKLCNLPKSALTGLYIVVAEPL
jgi:predicted nicotinamide N-methyase